MQFDTFIFFKLMCSGALDTNTGINAGLFEDFPPVKHSSQKDLLEAHYYFTASDLVDFSEFSR